MTNNLNEEMYKKWGEYGEKINETFGFKDHIIDPKPLEKMFNEPSEKKKRDFINYCKEQIQILNDIQ